MKNKKLVKLTDDADQGLRQLRKDAGNLAKWAKRKYQLRKLKKMKIIKKERNLKF